MTEMWKQVSGFETLYAVSDQGRVMSLRRGRVLAPVKVSDDYLAVKLCKAGKATWRRIHRLVCAAFHGEPSKPGIAIQAAHLDGDKHNNRAANLAWKTPKENTAQKREHGTHQAGETHPRVKLTAEQVAEIRTSGLSSPTLAPLYGVHQSTIRNIRQGVRWREASQSVIAQTKGEHN